MNVLLVAPSQSTVYGMKTRPIYPPLGLLYIAAMLERHGHHVAVVDMDAQRLSDDQFYNRVAGDKPHVVGLSAVTPTVKHCYRLAQGIKSRFPGIVTVLGGIHPTIDPENAAGAPGVDYVAVGEAEHTIVDLLELLEGRIRDPSEIPGLSYRVDGVVRRTVDRELEPNLDALPFPAFHLLADLRAYAPPDAMGLPALPLITSRGCPGTCTYCCTKQIFGRRFRARSVANIVNEVDLLVNTFHAREVHFLDDTITANRGRVVELCAALKERNYPVRYEVSNGMRADMVDEEILGALKSIGLANVGFGVESGNDEILKGIKKGISKEQVRQAMALAKRLGFETWGFFMLGLPNETAQTIQDTIDFALELDPDFAKFLILKPFPGSEVFADLSAAGLVDTCDYDQYGVYTPPVHHLDALTSEQILQWQRRAFRRFYLRPSKIARHVWRLRSVTQLRLAVRNAVFVARTVFS